jgi:uncharacterized membrane protein YesL
MEGNQLSSTWAWFMHTNVRASALLTLFVMLGLVVCGLFPSNNVAAAFVVLFACLCNVVLNAKRIGIIEFQQTNSRAAEEKVSMYM